MQVIYDIYITPQSKTAIYLRYFNSTYIHSNYIF